MHFSKQHTIYFLCLATTLLLAGCKPKEPATVCQSFERIDAQDRCYASNEGLTLTAVVHKVTAEPSQFVWSIYPQSDTLSRNIAGFKERVLVGTDQMAVPDSLLEDSPMFVAKVATICEGRRLESMYYSFVRRTRPGTSCSVWVFKE